MDVGVQGAKTASLKDGAALRERGCSMSAMRCVAWRCLAGRRDMGVFTRVAFALAVMVQVSGCATLLKQLDDPNEVLGANLNTDKFVKSLRCEALTFIVENRLRLKIYNDAVNQAQGTRDQALIDHVHWLLENYPFIELDEAQYAALGVDIKNIDMATLSMPGDWKTMKKTSAVVRDSHFGPAMAETNTFEYIPPLAIPQYADLGPAVSFNPPGQQTPRAALWSSIYNFQPTTDESFYCYRSLAFSHAVSAEDAANEIETLLLDGPGAQNFAQFQRIYVGTVTLAKWLQDMTGQLSYNAHTSFGTYESVVVGQIEYTFTLDFKPSIDAKYTYMGYVVNPFVPELSASVEHSGQFTIVLNTDNAVPATTAKQGNSCIADPQLKSWVTLATTSCVYGKQAPACPSGEHRTPNGSCPPGAH
jgi:hypothetical protein